MRTAPTPLVFEDAAMAAARAALAARTTRFARTGGLHRHPALPGLMVFRADGLNGTVCGVYEPCVALIVQGSKRVVLGGDTLTYDSGRYLITSLDLPAVATILEASPERPYLALVLRLDLREIAGLMLSGLATIVNGAWGWLLITRGRRDRSPALAADGWHLITDVVTSVGVLLGLMLVALTGWHVLDPILAALVAGYILWAGGQLMKESMSGLMDEAVAADVAARINETIASTAHGALQVHDLRTRISGRATFIEFHLVVPGRMAVATAHNICDRVEAALEAAIPGCSVLIHVEPEAEAQDAGALILKAAP